MTLTEYEAQYNAAIPLFRAALYGDGPGAAQAWIRARPEAPLPPPPPPRPGPVWIVRPPYLPSDAPVSAESRSWGARVHFGGEFVDFGSNGRHCSRTMGRRKAHGCLDTRATLAALNAWYTAKIEQEAAHNAAIRKISRECKVAAIRGGQGWILGKRKGDHELRYFLYSPQRDLWRVDDAYDTTYVPRSEIVEVVEESEAPPACPRLTMEEIRDVLIAAGCTVHFSNNREGRLDASLSAEWKGVAVVHTYRQRGDPFVELHVGRQVFPQTVEGVREWLAASVKDKQGRLKKQADEIAAQLEQLDTFGVT